MSYKGSHDVALGYIYNGKMIEPPGGRWVTTSRPHINRVITMTNSAISSPLTHLHVFDLPANGLIDVTLLVFDISFEVLEKGGTMCI
jgi:hypothetical protein